MITIYKITNPKGKIYIGQTKDYRKRLNHYRILNCRTQYKLHNSLKKYGFNNHMFEIIEEIGISISDEREQYWIEYYKCYWKDENKGLNLNKGGNRPKFTQESKDKLSKAILGSKHYRAKKLYQYNIDGSFIKEWLCMRDIQRELGYNTTCLSRAAKKNILSYNFIWSYIPLH
jgi:hypothetical protein